MKKKLLQNIIETQAVYIKLLEKKLADVSEALEVAMAIGEVLLDAIENPENTDAKEKEMEELTRRIL